MKPTTYIETSIVSYLTARLSRDVVLAAHQRITQEWWERRDEFDLYISYFVEAEASRGDEDAAAARLSVLGGIPALDTTEEAEDLARALLAGGGLPEVARVDAFHVAIATVHGIDYLLTWNCKHIANASLRDKISEICWGEGYVPPILCTPLELPEEAP